LSGRGVGTDAVKKTVEELGGRLFIESEHNKGTILTMELPVSVALTNIFHVRMNKINYGISMEQIVETIKVKKEQIEKANRKPFIRVRGNLIPLVFEKHLLPDDQEDQNIHNVVVLQGKTSQFGLVVNDFVNQLDVVQKPLEGILADHPMVSGTSLLGNGDIIFIIDATKIVDEN
jgi:two-component system chemotaxis sensor kinase CheA